MPSMLDQHLALYANDEQWKNDHVDAMSCYNVEETIGLGFSFLEQIEARPRPEKITVDYALKTCRLYECWYNGSQNLLGIIDYLQGKDYEVKHADDFRQKVSEVSPRFFAARDLCQSLERLKAGKGASLRAVMDGLRGNS